VSFSKGFVDFHSDECHAFSVLLGVIRLSIVLLCVILASVILLVLARCHSDESPSFSIGSVSFGEVSN
jgi:hypothetical protein